METPGRRSPRAAASAEVDPSPEGPSTPLAGLLASWPGRILVRTAAAFARIEVFDRSMTVAAQFFTSVFPLLILFATWASRGDSGTISESVSMPEESRSVVQDAVDAAGGAGFGIAGTILVLISATGVSRALTRAFAATWELPRPKSNVKAAWRWLAAALVLGLAVVMVRSLIEWASGLPPSPVWHIGVSLACDIAIAWFVPWVLLAGLVHPRLLLPGALICGLLMLTVRPATAAWLPHALDVSAERYGFIGVTFTYLAWLNIVSLCFLASAVLGQVVATDRGWLGTRIRGEVSLHERSTGLP